MKINASALVKVGDYKFEGVWNWLSKCLGCIFQTVMVWIVTSHGWSGNTAVMLCVEYKVKSSDWV